MNNKLQSKNYASYGHEATVTDTIMLTGLHCADCAAKLEKSLTSLDGILRATINFNTAKLRVEYQLDKIHRGDIISQVQQYGYDVVSSSGQQTVLQIRGLDCADCAAKLEKAVQQLTGVTNACLNFGAATMKVEHTIGIQPIINLIKKMGYQVVVKGEIEKPQSFLLRNRRALTTVTSGLLVGVGFLARWLALASNIEILLFSLAILIGGYYTARAGLLSLLRGFSMDMNVLMIIAVLGAVGIGQWEEAATVVFLFALGHTLEAYSMDKTRRSIKSLMEIAPREALVKRNGEEITVPIAQVMVGETVIIRPGERVAVDGYILKGQTVINQAPITGESMPVDKTAGDEVFAGTINGNGAIEVQVSKQAQDSTLAKIIKMVEEAQQQKAPLERFVDVFARYYTPTVIILAVLLAVIPPLFLAQPFAPWFYRALTLLVVSCPCALVISTPVAVVAAIGNAARQGVLIKGGAYLERAGEVKTVAFDKTGTLTIGRPEVTDLIPLNNFTSEQVLIMAAAVEARSEHIIAEAVLNKAKDMAVSYPTGEHFVALTGKGAKAKVKGQNCYVGNPEFFSEDLQLSLEPVKTLIAKLQQQGKTVVLVGSKHQIAGVLALADKVKETSAKAIKLLKEMGVNPIMLTGDNEHTARMIAKKLGIDDIKAHLLPQHKVLAIKELQTKKPGLVAMIGDGINDAPALAKADLSLAMGGAGTDVALDTADIAIMSDDPAKVAYVMRLSKRTLAIIKQNIAFALVVKLLAVILVFPGILNLWMAILADTGTALLVILNGMRLLRLKPKILKN